MTFVATIFAGLAMLLPSTEAIHTGTIPAPKKVKKHPTAKDCNKGSREWSPRENMCVILRTFPKSVKYGAMRVARCESGFDEKETTPPYGASGLFQFLPSTWRGTPYGRKSVFNPIWNAKAAHWLWKHDGNSWHEWVCRP
jgi:hypothetical protein